MSSVESGEENVDHQPLLDVVPPGQIARLILAVGVKKCQLAFLPLVTLAILAGAFIALGAMFYTVVVTGSTLGLGPTRLLGGVAFSLGLILIVVGGAELFTGNSLIVLARVEGKVTSGELLRNWGIVYLGNMVGALGIAVLAHAADALSIGDGLVAATAIGIAQGKIGMGPIESLARGILCNTLVCLAVWMCFAAHTVSGKILAIVFPITAFVTLGFEHSVANMYLLPIVMLHDPGVVSVSDIVANLFPVTIGNIVGGGLFVGGSYWLIYVSDARSAAVPRDQQRPSVDPGTR